MTAKNKNIIELRWEKIARVMREKHLDMVMACASLQDFGFGVSLSGLKPILYHYLTLDSKSGKAKRGYFVPYFLVGRLGLSKKPGVVTFDDKTVPEEFARFLAGKKRVGIIGPAPALHFSRASSQLIFLDDLLWPLLNVKSPTEISGVKKTAEILKKVLVEAGKRVRTGVKLETLAGDIDRQVLKQADALAFPSLVESDFSGQPILSLLGVQDKIHAKDAIYINVGAEYAGFYADAGRMFFLDNDALAREYALLEKAFALFVRKIKPGMLLCHLPELLRAEMKASGLHDLELNDKYLGHSVGFNIINLPYIGRDIFTREKVLANTTISFFIEAKVIAPGAETAEGAGSTACAGGTADVGRRGGRGGRGERNGRAGRGDHDFPVGLPLKLQETVRIGARGNAILTR